MAKKRKKTAGNTQPEFCLKAARSLLLIYIYLLVCIYPFLIKPGYEETSRIKSGFLIAVSYGIKAGPLRIPTFVPLALLCILTGTVLHIKRSGEGIKAALRSIRFSATDIMVVLYILFATISAIASPYREYTFWGVKPSYMGLAAQLLFVSIYFISSRLFDTGELRLLVYASFAASAIVFVIGILQRFGYDIFDLYHGLENKLFISTIGQHTYFSAYLILFYILGVFAVWISDRGTAMHRAAIIHLIIASCLPCILNADMIYAGLFIALSFLFVMSFESMERLTAFFDIALMILLTWRILGIVWYLAKPEFRLEPMSQFILLSPWIWIPVAVIGLIRFFLHRQAEAKGGADIGKYKPIGYIYAVLLGSLMVGLIVYIILNTKQLLPESLRSDANYLLFDAFWGNGRGAIWHDSVMSFMEELKETPMTAILGAGPDQFFYVLDRHVHDWLIIYTDQLALYAHNEWLNAFICCGIFGGAAYLGIFISALIRFVKHRVDAPLAPGAAVLVVSYIAHQMFGYQQIISTPYIFLILGIGERLVRSRDK